MTNKSQRLHRADKTEKWNSKDGYFNQLMACEICHSDAECVLRLDARWLSMRYTCYRALGPGTESDPRWVALLTGEGQHQRSGHEYDVFCDVFQVGHQNLRRSGFKYEIHRLPDGGIFDICSSGREYGTVEYNQ